MNFLKTVRKTMEIRDKFKNKKITASNSEWLRNTIQEMGPTYVKIGQFISNRSDIFDENIIKSLKLLQDKVDPIKYETVIDIINSNNSNLFIKQISKKPIASASISQVHTIRGYDSKQYVVKIRRPNIYNDINDELNNLILVLKMMKYLKMQNIDETISLVTDIKTLLLEETDFAKEVEKIKLFGTLLNERENVLVPIPYEKACTEETIVMTYVESVRLYNLNFPSSKKKQIAYDLMDTFLFQLIEKGVVHGDPHEGNVGYNIKEEKFVFYDLGNVLFVDKEFRTNIKLFIYYLYFENIVESINILKKIKYITINDELMLELYLRKYSKYIKTVDISIMNLDSKLLQSVPVKFDITILQVIRVFGLIEGICKSLDPEFNYTEIFLKYILSDSVFIEQKISDDIKSILELMMKNLR